MRTSDFLVPEQLERILCSQEAPAIRWGAPGSCLSLTANQGTMPCDSVSFHE